MTNATAPSFRIANRLRRPLLGGIAVTCIAITGVWIRSNILARTPTVEPRNTILIKSTEPIQPIDTRTDLDARKVTLGRNLFTDPRLSHDNQISCSTCHNLKTGGTDRKARSIGIYGAIGAINSPTIFNSSLNFRQFWDGRSGSLEEQIDEPVQSRTEMGSTWPEVTQKLRDSSDYRYAFGEIYVDGVQANHVRDSIAEFERSLSTPNSRFDRYLRHDMTAITDRELQGYKLFKSVGCASCHQGANIGGNMYQKLGVMVSYFADRGSISTADRGRFNVTGDQQDMYMFKVPSLRNVDLTPPYFHDGSAATLSDAVGVMAKYQLGHTLTDHERDLIVDFLKTLTGELNGQLL